MELNLYAALLACFLAYLIQPFGLQDVSDLREISQLWSNLTNITSRSEQFHARYDISNSLPTGEESWRDYRRVEVALLKWHNELYQIQDSLSYGRSSDKDHSKLLVSALTLETQRTDKRYTDDRRGLYNTRGKADKYSKKGRKHKKRKDSSGKRKRQNRGHHRHKNNRKKSKRRIESWEIDEEGEEYDEYVEEKEIQDEDDGAGEEAGDEQHGKHEPQLGDTGVGKRKLNHATHLQQNVKLSPSTIGWISRVLTMYVFTVALSSASSDPKLIIFTFLLTLLILPLVWRGKQMNDALSDAVVGLRLRQVQLAGVFPSSSKAEMIAQALILQKIEVITTYWEKQALGLSFKIPFIDMPISLENEILGGMFVANVLKLIEVFFSKKEEKKSPVRPNTRIEMNAMGMKRD